MSVHSYTKYQECREKGRKDYRVPIFEKTIKVRKGTSHVTSQRSRQATIKGKLNRAVLPNDVPGVYLNISVPLICNKKHNVSVAVTKPSPRVRSSAPPNSVPQDGILDGKGIFSSIIAKFSNKLSYRRDVVNENRQWHSSSCHRSGQRINLAAEGVDIAQRNSSIHRV
ncbi:hypothetical protein Tco_1530724 [Tanacetum coccineum]